MSKHSETPDMGGGFGDLTRTFTKQGLELERLRNSHAGLLAALRKMAREHSSGCVACWTRTQIAQDAIEKGGTA